MGCDCGRRSGCDDRKEAGRALLDRAIALVYPVSGPVGGPRGRRAWGRLDDEARFGVGVRRAEARRLARSLSAVTEAPTFFREGADEDLCDFVWILCIGREPALLDLRDGQRRVEAPPEAGWPLEEKYLRVALSSVARIAAVQEVRLRLALEADGTQIVTEGARPGVFDPVLLARLQKAAALLEAAHVSHVDFDLLDAPLEDADGAAYEERYGVPPRLVNYLFFAAPATTMRVTLVSDLPPAPR